MSDTIQSVPVASIKDPAFNSRVILLDPANAQDLEFIQSIKREGIKVPLKVRAAEGGASFTLIWGSRRLAAAKAAGFKDVPCIVVPYQAMAGSDPEIQDSIDNVLENVARKDLSPYEQARAFSHLRDLNVKLDDIVDKVGLSKPYIVNLTAIYKKCDPVIVTEWMNGNKAATVNFLRDVANEKDAKKQVAMFKAREAQLKEAADDMNEPDEETKKDETDSEPREKKSYTVPVKRYQTLLRRLRATKQPQLTIQVARYLVGLEDAIKGIIDAPASGEDK